MISPPHACVICTTRQPEPGWLTCALCPLQLAGRLHALPPLWLHLAGLGYVQRDNRPGTRPVRAATGIVREPGWPADPVAHTLTAGPLKAPVAGPRVGGSPTAPVPADLGSVDLLAPARAGSVAVHVRSPWPDDQIGRLSVATELDFWARDWAGERSEHLPVPTVAVLAPWLANRAPWACQYHPAVDEMAEAVRRLHGTLRAACGLTEPRREHLIGPCPDCAGSLYRDSDSGWIACEDCPRLLDEAGYAGWCRELIEQEGYAA